MTHNTRRADGVGNPKQKRYNRLNPDEFVDNAKTLVELGWHPVPLGGPKGKTLLVRGVTGHGGVDVSDESMFREWADTWSATERGLNLGVRMPPCVIGIDVDCYEGKPGAATLAEYESLWGALPPTWSVTARSDGSRKMFFRVPDGWTSRGVLGPGIELIQRHHRYSVAPPSYHGRGRVCAYAPDGHDCGQLPPPDELPNLPRAWVQGLAHDAGPSPKGSVADADAVEGSFLDGPMSPVVHRHVDAVLAAVADSAGRYDAMRDAVMGLVRLGSLREKGVPAALRMIETEYVAAVIGTRDEQTASDEFNRAKTDALRIVAGGELMDYDTRSAFEPGGAWHCDTAWIRDGDYWMRGVPDSAGDGSGDASSSWCPADVTAALTGDGPPMPTVLSRDDGACLFYAGKVHSVHGESESGKSWVVQCAAAQQLLGDGAVLYVDFEDDVSGVVNRLALLGVPREVLADQARFVYVHPEESLSGDAARGAFDALVSQSFTLAVVDGVTDAMGVFGYSLKDNDDIAAWQRELPRTIASRTGAAVACVDHVTKDADTRGRFSIGGQHKIAGLDGAAFVVEVERPFGVGMAGVASIRVGKDRPGHVRKMGVGWRKGDRTQRVGTFNLDSTASGLLAWTLEAPNTVASEPKSTSASRDPFRPTWFMEQVSRYWEATADPSDRTQNKTVNAMCEERKAAGRKENRQKWREAIELLVAEEFAVVEVGPRNANCHRVVIPYRHVQDPQADGYTGGKTFTFSVDSGGDGSTVDRADHAGTVP